MFVVHDYIAHGELVWVHTTAAFCFHLLSPPSSFALHVSVPLPFVSFFLRGRSGTYKCLWGLCEWGQITFQAWQSLKVHCASQGPTELLLTPQQPQWPFLCTTLKSHVCQALDWTHIMNRQRGADQPKATCLRCADSDCFRISLFLVIHNRKREHFPGTDSNNLSTCPTDGRAQESLLRTKTGTWNCSGYKTLCCTS